MSDQEHGDWLRRLRGYAEDREKIVKPIEQRAFDAEQQSQAWALLGVKNAFIANAGGAGVIPIVDRLLQTQPGGPGPQLDLIGALIWFALGILAAALTCLSAYLNFGNRAVSLQSEAAADTVNLINQHFPRPVDASEIAKLEDAERRADRMVQFTFYAGIVLAIASFGCFLTGVITAMP